jgi:hypothetical protein
MAVGGQDTHKNEFAVNNRELLTAPTTTPIYENGTLAYKTKQLDGYVGFVNLPNQVYRKAVKKGFEFNFMVVGKTLLALTRTTAAIKSFKAWPILFATTTRSKKLVGCQKINLSDKTLNICTLHSTNNRRRRFSH